MVILRPPATGPNASKEGDTCARDLNLLKKTTYEVSANLVGAEPRYGMGKNPIFAIFRFLAKKANRYLLHTKKASFFID